MKYTRPLQNTWEIRESISGKWEAAAEGRGRASDSWVDGGRADESELHKGYETVAMNPPEPEPCEPLAADGGRCTQPAPVQSAWNYFLFAFGIFGPKHMFQKLIHIIIYKQKLINIWHNNIIMSNHCIYFPLRVTSAL